MAEDKEVVCTDCLVHPLQRSSPILEILCKSSGKVRRFALGTEARFALQLINQKLPPGVPLASYIEAVKPGEESISFGPTSVLIDYGDGWKLQAVTNAGFQQENVVEERTLNQFPDEIVASRVCFECGEGHWNKDCPWLDYPCIKGCPYKMKLYRSSREWSYGKRFLTCRGPSCNAYFWLDKTVSISNEKGKRIQSSNFLESKPIVVEKTSKMSTEGKVKLDIQGKQPMTIEGNVDWDGIQVKEILHPYESPKGNTTVASDSPNTDKDWTSHFNVDIVFESRDQLQRWITETGRKHKMALVVKKSDFTKGRNPRIFFGCDKGGTYKVSKKSQPPESEKSEKSTRKTTTKKCDCPFLIKAIRHPRDADHWVTEVSCGVHNHELSSSIESHSYHARLTSEERELFINLSKGGIKPKVALSIIKEKNPNNSSSLQTLYNVKKKIRKEEMDD